MTSIVMLQDLSNGDVLTEKMKSKTFELKEIFVSIVKLGLLS